MRPEILGSGGGVHAASRLQALMPIPPGYFGHSKDSGRHLWGDRDV